MIGGQHFKALARKLLVLLERLIRIGGGPDRHFADAASSVLLAKHAFQLRFQRRGRILLEQDMALEGIVRIQSQECMS